MDIPVGQTELRILLLEDEPTDAELIENALHETGLSFVSRRVDTRESFMEALEEFKPDIILADYKLPAFDGASAVKMVRRQYPTVPVVMVTGAMGDEKAVELLGLGARDYILKDRLARLGPAVQRALSAEQGIRARKAAEKALRESEADLRTLVEHSPIAMLVDTGVDANEKIIMMNQQFTKLFGYTMEDVPDVRHWWPLAYPDEKYREGIKAEWLRRVEKAIQNHVDIEPMEVTVTCKKGLRRYVRVSLASIGNRNIITFEDLTGRKQAEARIQKLALLYATLSQTNTIIVHSTNREELFCNICKAAVTHGKFALAWVGLVDEATRRVNPVHHYGAEEGYLENIVISADDVPEGRGPSGTSIRENRVFYVNDFAADERAWPWREAALARGYRSSVGLPLRQKGKVIGALTMYSDEPGFFDVEQLNLMEEMSNDISFALDGFEREARRQQAEEERETALKKLRGALEDSIRVAASISEVRDPYTAGHQQRVSQLAVAIAREMGLSAAQVDGIRFGSLIHDIGKIGVPAEILSKPSNLTPLEMQLIQIHPQAGYDIVKEIEFPWPVAQMILQHHERLDGSGYPVGLKGNDILQEARVIAVADTVEAMSSHRPYRPGLGMDVALMEIANAIGTLYDRQAVEACLRLIREKGFTFNPD